MPMPSSDKFFCYEVFPYTPQPHAMEVPNLSWLWCGVTIIFMATLAMQEGTFNSAVSL